MNCLKFTIDSMKTVDLALNFAQQLISLVSYFKELTAEPFIEKINEIIEAELSETKKEKLIRLDEPGQYTIQTTKSPKLYIELNNLIEELYSSAINAKGSKTIYETGRSFIGADENKRIKFFIFLLNELHEIGKINSTIREREEIFKVIDLKIALIIDYLLQSKKEGLTTPQRFETFTKPLYTIKKSLERIKQKIFQNEYLTQITENCENIANAEDKIFEASFSILIRTLVKFNKPVDDIVSQSLFSNTNQRQSSRIENSALDLKKSPIIKVINYLLFNEGKNANFLANQTVLHILIDIFRTNASPIKLLEESNHTIEQKEQIKNILKKSSLTELLNSKNIFKETMVDEIKDANKKHEYIELLFKLIIALINLNVATLEYRSIQTLLPRYGESNLNEIQKNYLCNFCTINEQIIAGLINTITNLEEFIGNNFENFSDIYLYLHSKNGHNIRRPGIKNYFENFKREQNNLKINLDSIGTVEYKRQIKESILKSCLIEQTFRIFPPNETPCVAEILQKINNSLPALNGDSQHNSYFFVQQRLENETIQSNIYHKLTGVEMRNQVITRNQTHLQQNPNQNQLKLPSYTRAEIEFVVKIKEIFEKPYPHSSDGYITHELNKKSKDDFSHPLHADLWIELLYPMRNIAAGYWTAFFNGYGGQWGYIRKYQGRFLEALGIIEKLEQNKEEIENYDLQLMYINYILYKNLNEMCIELPNIVEEHKQYLTIIIRIFKLLT